MLTLRGISKRYPGGIQALQNVDLEIPPGLFGLLGPNGAGKSTLMRTIATLQSADSGEIRLGELDAIGHPNAVRAQLGYLPQDFGVYPRISAHALLHHIAELKGLSDRRSRNAEVDWVLAQTNLQGAAKRAVADFSGGMRQRFGIAQALLGRPKLIIVDEPTAGLDPEERNRFHNLLAEISREVIVILSTHIVDDVADLCRDMAILSEGRIRARGNPQELTRQLDGRVWSVEIDPANLDGIRQNHRVISSYWRAGRRVVHVESEQRPGEAFEPVTPSLEDFYFSTLNQSH